MDLISFYINNIYKMSRAVNCVGNYQITNEKFPSFIIREFIHVSCIHKQQGQRPENRSSTCVYLELLLTANHVRKGSGAKTWN